MSTKPSREGGTQIALIWPSPWPDRWHVGGVAAPGAAGLHDQPGGGLVVVPDHAGDDRRRGLQDDSADGASWGAAAPEHTRPRPSSPRYPGPERRTVASTPLHQRPVNVVE